MVTPPGLAAAYERWFVFPSIVVTNFKKFGTKSTDHRTKKRNILQTGGADWPWLMVKDDIVLQPSKSLEKQRQIGDTAKVLTIANWHGAVYTKE